MAGEKQARYVITADDRTQAAINSAQRAFKGLDSAVGGVAKSINMLSGLFIGAKLVGGFRDLTAAVVEAAKANDQKFAASLGKVDEQMKNLLTPTSGLPAATKAMEELSEKLKDPALVDAADRVSSAVLTAWAHMKGLIADAVIGWDHIMAGPTTDSGKIRAQLDELFAQRNQLKASMAGGAGSPLAGSLGAQMLEARTQKLADLERRITELQVKNTNGVDLASFRPTAEFQLAPFKPTAKGRETEPEWMDAYRQAIAAADGLTQTGTEKVLAEWQKFDDSLAYMLKNGAISKDEASKRATEYRDTVLTEVHPTVQRVMEEFKAIKPAIADLSEYSKEAMRGIQGDLKQFFLDPAEEGIRGLGRSIIETFKNVLADKAAAQLAGYFASFAGGGERDGKGGWLGSAVGALFGGFRADGGPVMAGTSYLVGERGPELFTPRTAGGITPNGGGRAPIINNTWNVDARGATQDVIAALPALMRQQSAETEGRIIDGLRRHRYGL